MKIIIAPLILGIFTASFCQIDSLNCKKLKGLTIESLEMSGKIDTLSKLIDKGNECALKMLYKARGYYSSSPAILEMLDIAAGISIQNHPNMFLRITKDYFSNDDIRYLGGILCNFGDDYVDEFVKQAEEVDRRIKSLKTVKDKELIKIRDECIKILEEHRHEIEELVNSIPPNYLAPRK